jgi:hypothetical protein
MFDRSDSASGLYIFRLQAIEEFFEAIHDKALMRTARDSALDRREEKHVEFYLNGFGELYV